MRIVILGAGRLGARLANVLVSEGQVIDIVDQDEAKFKSLSDHPNLRHVHGDIFNDEVMATVFTTPPDVFIVVTGSDNINLMVAQAIKRQYPIPRVLVRVFDPTLAEVYNNLGMETVCPTNYAVAEMHKMIQQAESPSPRPLP